MIFSALCPLFEAGQSENREWQFIVGMKFYDFDQHARTYVRLQKYLRLEYITYRHRRETQALRVIFTRLDGISPALIGWSLHGLLS